MPRPAGSARPTSAPTPTRRPGWWPGSTPAASIPTDWLTTSQGKTPADFLIAQQNADGSFQWKPGDRTHNLYSTQNAVRSLSGAAFSAPPVMSKTGTLLRPAPSVAAGTSLPLTLVVDTGAGAVAMCEVRAPVAAPIATLLDNAVAGDTPANCVTHWTRSSDGQRVAELNGISEVPGSRAWHIERNGATAALADPLALGDMVSLTYGP